LTFLDGKCKEYVGKKRKYQLTKKRIDEEEESPKKGKK